MNSPKITLSLNIGATVGLAILAIAFSYCYTIAKKTSVKNRLAEARAEAEIFERIAKRETS